jgi:hypothetical protein
MSIKNARLVGYFKPPADSTHHPRPKHIRAGQDTDDGKTVRYYEQQGRIVRIDAAEWVKWRKVSK